MAAITRAYFRTPLLAGKQALWDRVVRPRILWRDLEFKAKTRFGARMFVQFPDTVQSRIYFFGIWEPALTHYVIKTLRRGDTFIDIGANVGYYTLLASSQVGGAGRVYSIEASPSVFNRLRRNLKLNRTKNVKPINAAVHSEIGVIPFYLHQAHPGLSTIVADEAKRLGASFEAMVEAGPLSRFVPEADIIRAKLIKIDAEAAEWLIVRGLSDLLPRLSPDTEILIEVNGQVLAEEGISTAFFGAFTQSGFIAYQIKNDYTPRQYWQRTAEIEITRLGDFEFRETLDLLFRRS
jgi:FkbM family methyltransferase